MLTVRPVEAHPGCKMGKESEQDKIESRDTRSEVSVGPRLETMEAGNMVKGSGGKADWTNLYKAKSAGLGECKEEGGRFQSPLRYT